MKKIAVILILLSTNIFAQKTDLLKNNLKGNPRIIEESVEKAIIKTNIIEGYFQEYYNKTYFNSSGNVEKIENFDENGELNSIESFKYANDKILEIEKINNDETLVILKKFEYNELGFKVLLLENEILISETFYILDQNKNIVEQKEINLIDESLTTSRNNEFKDNFLVKTVVKYGKDGYIIQYKYGKSDIPSEEIIYDLKNKLVSKKIRKFDSSNNLVEENLFDQDGKLKTNNRIQYEYDENGNWIKRTQYANQIETPVTHSKRTIKY